MFFWICTKQTKTDFYSSLPYKLRDWIDVNAIHWDELSRNPNAIDMLRANPKKINWERLSYNKSPNAIDIRHAAGNVLKKDSSEKNDSSKVSF